jgi:hypothetical protein
MNKPKGKTIAITPFRNLVIDFLHFSRAVPAVSIDRPMNLAPLVEARMRCPSRPMWTSMFTKAYAIVAMRQPLLRQSYMSFPWARFYEHPKNIAAINVSRRVGDEDVVMQMLIRKPENRSLEELDAIMRHGATAPVEEFTSYRRATRVSYLPGTIRRGLMWLTLNWLGRRRCHNFGTFGITSVAERGAGVLHTIPLLTSMIHYGMFDDKGRLDVRFTFDHRVLDGVPAAEVMVALEGVLLGEILAEVKGMAPAILLPGPGRMAA